MKILIFLILILFLHAYSYGGKAVSKWKIKLQVYSHITRIRENVEFIFDSGSPALISLSTKDFARFGSSIRILGKDLAVVESFGKYAPYNILGRQFLTATDCQIIKNKFSDKI